MPRDLVLPICQAPGCGRPLPPPADTGRPAEYCSTTCRARAWRRTRAELEAIRIADTISAMPERLLRQALAGLPASQRVSLHQALRDALRPGNGDIARDPANETRS